MLNILQSPISFPAINPFLISKTNIKHPPLKERLLSPIYGPTLLLLLAACHHNSSRTNRDEMENMLANAPQTILIEGSEGDDTDLSGTSGDDKYIASDGSDGIDGEAGSDTVDYSEWDGHIQVTAQADGSLQIEKYNAEGVLAGTDTLTNIERLINQKGQMQFVQTADDTGQTLRGHTEQIGGQTKRDFDDVLVGGAGADTLNGDVGDDVLIGGAGDDTLNGGLARDLLIGGAGADELDGGTKIDTASYAGSDAGVRVNLHTGKGRGGHAQGDTLENIENLIGSDFDDVLTGADLVDNTFEGRGGADILDGRSDSSDKDGNSSLGGDIASYQTSDKGVTINLANMKFAKSVRDDGFSGSPVTVQAGTDNYIIVTKAGALSAVTEAEIAALTFGNYVVLAGLNGDGDITWQRSFGGDAFFTSNGAVHTLAINPTAGGGQSLFRQGLSYTGIGGHADGDVLIDIEGVVGSAHDDNLTGNAEDNKIKGGLGDDTLDGGAGFDLVGFEFAQQQDVRTDTITTTESDPRSYNLSEDGIDIDGVVFVLGEDGSAAYYNGAEGDDTFMNFEGVTGSMFNDYLVGNSDVNDLHGSNGDDIVRGEGGNDNLFGGGGDDIVYGGAGDDMIYGGHSDDKLFGGTGADIIKADAGKDTLDGGADTVRDTLTGGAGDDIFVASAASGTVLAGADIVTDFTAGDKIQLQLTQTQRNTIDAITGDAAKLAELKKVIEIAAEDADGQSDTNDTVLTNKGMDGAVGGDDDTVLMVLEDYDTALTFDDFALEVI